MKEGYLAVIFLQKFLFFRPFDMDSTLLQKSWLILQLVWNTLVSHYLINEPFISPKLSNTTIKTSNLMSEKVEQPTGVYLNWSPTAHSSIRQQKTHLIGTSWLLSHTQIFRRKLFCRANVRDETPYTRHLPTYKICTGFKINNCLTLKANNILTTRGRD